MTAPTSDTTPLSTAPYPREDARNIARAFLPKHALGNRYDYYYTLTKLRTDPLYPGVLQALRPTTAPVLDLGCGLGLLAHALRADGQALPFTGVDIDAAKIRRGRQVAARTGLADVQLDVLDLGIGLPAHKGSVAILDVLQYLSPERQRELLDNVIAMLVPGARLVIRSGLADETSRSRTSRITDRLANFAGWMQERAKSYPTADGLRSQLEGAGLQTTLRPLYGDTPFNNWLIVGVRE